MMSFSESVCTCMRKFFVTSGRASRSEFWSFQFFVFLMTFFIYSLTMGNLWGDELLILRYFLLLILFIPNFCVHIRRLHDVGCSGYYILFDIIPLGAIYLFILALFPSESNNKYGPKPFSEKKQENISVKQKDNNGIDKQNLKEVIDVEI